MQMNRPDNVTFAQDLLQATSSGIQNAENIISPEQISDKKRMKGFSDQVLQLLKPTPSCAMTFRQFVASYYHQFSKECKASDYGYPGLAELFEAVRCVEVIETENDDIVSLCGSDLLKVAAERVTAVIKANPLKKVEISRLCSEFSHLHKFELHPLDFGFECLTDLLEKIKKYDLKIVSENGLSYVRLSPIEDSFLQISLKIRSILMEQPNGVMKESDLSSVYEERFGQEDNLSSYLKQQPHIVKIHNGYLQLTPLHLLAKNLIILLHENSRCMKLCNVENAFLMRFGVPLCIASYGFDCISSLFENLLDYFKLTGKKRHPQFQHVHLRSEKKRGHFLHCQTSANLATLVSSLNDGQKITDNCSISNSHVSSSEET